MGTKHSTCGDRWPRSLPSKTVCAGAHITLERNPYYWKVDRKGNRLPYLEEITFLVAGNEDAEVLRFEAGETEIVDRVTADNYAVLEREQSSHGFRLYDLGPGLEYNFLLLNLNSTLPSQARRFSGSKLGLAT